MIFNSLIMKFNNIIDIKKAGFVGFKKMQELFVDCSALPDIKGVYLILYLEKKAPKYLQIGTGGRFKGKDPNVPIQKLQDNWVDRTIVVYIGKAGSNGGSATIKSRLKQYFSFGQGKNIGHWGGRYIWQLSNASNLLVCWKQLPTAGPRAVEIELLQDFMTQYNVRPFANLSN